ncbi:hotdog fold thioesterase [Kytococcus sedentarius]|uniref:hotdog fold thioesterase n=1 Tax=Kytococcus sedentarius TaxID=1276 RepID=UPI0035BC3E70
MTWHDGLRATTTDGTDLAHVRSMWEIDGASAHLGIEVLDLDRVEGLGRAVASMTITDTMVNGHGTTHGGMVFTFCDSVFALTCNTSGVTTVAAHCDIDFLAATQLGDVLVAVGTERFRWGRNGMTDVVVHRAPAGVHLPSGGDPVPQDLSAWPVVAVFTGRSKALPRR